MVHLEPHVAGYFATACHKIEFGRGSLPARSFSRPCAEIDGRADKGIGAPPARAEGLDHSRIFSEFGNRFGQTLLF